MSTSPTVILADTYYWEAFSRFGAALQRRGVRVERLTGAPQDLPNRLRSALQRLIFPGVAQVAGWVEGAPDLPMQPLLARPQPALALEASDDLAAALLSSSTTHPYRRTCGVEEGLLYDKLAITRFVSSLGIGVPRTWSDRSDLGHGQRLVLKHKLGFGGHGVKIVAATPGEVQQASAELSEHADDVFLQEMVAGETVHVGGVARQGQVLVSAAYLSRSSMGNGLGPATSIEIVDDADLRRDAATIVGALGYTGSFGMDFVRAPAGAALFIDFNSRIFGSWLGLQHAGLDFLGAYQYAYGLSGCYRPDPARPGRVISILWTTSVADRDVPLLRTYVRSVLQSLTDSRVLGTRWLLVALVDTTAAALLRLARSGAGAARRGLG